MYRLPAVSSAPGASCIPTMGPAAFSSTASDWVHLPGVAVSAACAVATQTRVAATTLTSKFPVIDAPQPPAAELLVPKMAYTWPVFWLTVMPDGPPESAHWRSSHAWSPGRVVGIGGPQLAPPAAEGLTEMRWLA